MNNDGTSGIGGDTSNSNAGVFALMQKLKSNDKNNNPEFLKSLQDQLFPEEKENRGRFRRLKQKQKSYQAVPISIDSITPDGKREIQKTLKGLFSFDMDSKKPDVKSGPWAKLFFILAFVIGFIIGAVLGFLDQIRKFFKFLKTSIQGLYGIFKETNIGKFITGLFKAIKSKIIQGITLIKDSKIGKIVKGFFNSIKQTVLSWRAAISDSKIVKSVKGFFNILSTRVISIFNAVKSLLFKVKNFFKPITSLFGKLKLPGIAFKGFLGFLSKLGGFFNLGLKAGKIFGKLLAPLFLVIEIVTGLFKAFNDDKLKDKSFFQKLLTGFISGILEFFDIFEIFGLNLISFDEIRDRIEKIFKPFREGKWLEGLNQILNQVVSFIVGLGGKVVGWLIGFFNKDLGEKTQKFFKDFDLVELTGKAFSAVKNWVVGLWDKITGFLKGLLGWVADNITWDNLKKLITLDLNSLRSKETETKEPKKVSDFLDTGDRTMYSQGQSYSFDKNDEILAIKNGGPIDNIIRANTEETNKSVDNLTRVVSDLSKSLTSYIKTSTTLQQAEQKIMIENVNLLKSIRDKDAGNNVIVQNSNSNTVFNEKGSTNLDYRKELSFLANF
jgi:hypothetical protein